jgi:hypothetical protein
MDVGYQQQVLAVTDADLAGWKVIPEGGPVEGATGLCPRCQHTTRETIEPAPVVMAAFLDDNVPSVDSLTHLAECACTQPHKDRPAGMAQGCGGEWLIRITKQGAEFLVGAGDLALLGPARAFNDATKTELDTVRGIAKNWVQGVAALLGLFSLAGLVFATSAVSGLSPGYQVLFAVLAAVALTAAAGGTYLAYRAAFGWPRQVKISDDAGLRKFFAEQQQRARDSAQALKAGVGLTFASVAALGLAIAVLWFGTPAIPASPLVSLTSSNGNILCGSLLTAGSGGSVRVRTTQGVVRTVPPGTVTKLTTVTSCP